MAAFAARALAERLQARLAGHGMAATRLIIEARTEAGEELHRVWRHDGLLDAAGIADRVRWQLDGWLTRVGRPGAYARASARPTAGIDRLRLVPDGVVRHAGMQSGLWGELGESDERAHRALVRVQGLLGPDSVFTAVLGGGRDYADRIRLVPWGDERSPTRAPEPPWPGRLPAPAPAIVPTEPVPAVVRAADGAPVEIDGRLAMSAAPAWVAIARDGGSEVVSWAGPWPAEERWWAPAEARRVCRLQVCLGDGRALLLALDSGTWAVEAFYD
jgi:protein ImuB